MTTPALGGSWEPPVNGPLRAVLATLLVLPIVGLTLAYHDGAFDVQPTASVDTDGPYRLKGVVERTIGTGEAQSFILRDDAGTQEVRWNATDVQAGRHYVVVGTYSAAQRTFQGEAVVRVYLLK